MEHELCDGHFFCNLLRHDCLNGNRFFAGLRDDSVQLNGLFASACTLDRSRSVLEACSGSIYGHLSLCACGALMGGQKRFVEGSSCQLMDSDRPPHGKRGYVRGSHSETSITSGEQYFEVHW